MMRRLEKEEISLKKKQKQWNKNKMKKIVKKGLLKWAM